MTQDTLFPLADLKTEGYAQPEPGVEVDVADSPEPIEDAA